MGCLNSTIGCWVDAKGHQVKLTWNFLFSSHPSSVLCSRPKSEQRSIWLITLDWCKKNRVRTKTADDNYSLLFHLVVAAAAAVDSFFQHKRNSFGRRRRRVVFVFFFNVSDAGWSCSPWLYRWFRLLLLSDQQHLCLYFQSHEQNVTAFPCFLLSFPHTIMALIQNQKHSFMHFQLPWLYYISLGNHRALFLVWAGGDGDTFPLF